MAARRGYLKDYLSLEWRFNEEAYYPNVKDFLCYLLGYPRQTIWTNVKQEQGKPDIVLNGLGHDAWVVGDVKKDDDKVCSDVGLKSLWAEKKDYVMGGTRYVLFLTQGYIVVLSPTGKVVTPPMRLESYLGREKELEERLGYLSYAESGLEKTWNAFVEDRLPYCYLTLSGDTHDGTANRRKLQADLQQCFSELYRYASERFEQVLVRYQIYTGELTNLEASGLLEDELQRALGYLRDLYRAEVEVVEHDLEFFRARYGRDLPDDEKRVAEAFVTDAVTAFVSRVLFLRLAEDMGLTSKRHVSNGGLKRWNDLVAYLRDDIRSCLKVAAEDMAALYPGMFEKTVFDWVQEGNGTLNEVLKHVLLRLNAYDFSGLDDEVLGSLYENFLDPAKRKRLGEFYTPKSIVDYILSRTVLRPGAPEGKLLDPACGSGSFLVRFVHAYERENLGRVSPETLGRDVVENTVGFDINPFAVFISRFQLLWAIVRLAPSTRQPLAVYNLNSLQRETGIMGHLTVPPHIQARDQQRYSYVVGNPPYIRAERFKYGSQMKTDWGHVWGPNSDTAIVFTYRGLTEWLEPGGSLGFVVTGGIANSDAAEPIRRILRDEVTLREVVWLEFVDRVWDAARVPMILIVDNKRPAPDEEILVTTPTDWPTNGVPTRFRYRDYFDRRVNPFSYILPLLHEDDVPVLKAVSGLPRLRDQGIQFKIGIQKGRGATVTRAPQEAMEPIRVMDGGDLAVAYVPDPIGWVDLGTVQKRSLWRREAGGKVLEGTPSPARMKGFVAVPELCLAPAAAYIQGDDIACLNNGIVATHDNQVFLKALAAYLNSSVVRFLYLVQLRAGVVRQQWSHLYARTLDCLPWPADVGPACLEELGAGYDALAALAHQARNTAEGWFADKLRKVSTVSLRSRVLGLDFSRWTVPLAVSDVVASDRGLRGCLVNLLEVTDEELLKYVESYIRVFVPPEGVVDVDLLEGIPVPKDYGRFVAEYSCRKARTSLEALRAQFDVTLKELDAVVGRLLGVTEHLPAIGQRLSTPPLSQMVPRYPWAPSQHRAVKDYDVDRFAG